jgi:hypothetical protein
LVWGLHREQAYCHVQHGGCKQQRQQQQQRPGRRMSYSTTTMSRCTAEAVAEHVMRDA